MQWVGVAVEGDQASVFNDKDSVFVSRDLSGKERLRGYAAWG